MVEPGNTPRLEEIYRLTRENNKMLHSMRRQAFWGGLLRLALYLAAFGVPIWLYFTYLSPVVQQLQDTVSEATGKKMEYEGQFAQWVALFEQFRDRMQGASSSAQ